MPTEMIIREVNSATPDRADAIASCEALHRQLRPDVEQPYVAHITAMLAEGACLAIGDINSDPHCLALYRVFKTTLGGTRLYIDDIVTTPAGRGHGYGATMLRWLEATATAQSCLMSTLDSGVQRAPAHRFYLRHGYDITAFSFEKAL